MTVKQVITIVAGAAAVLGHAVSAAAGDDGHPLTDPARGCPGLAVDVDCHTAKRLRQWTPTESVASADCFDVAMAGLSAQADANAPFDGAAITRIDGEVIVVATSAEPVNDLAMGHIEATRHTLTFPSDPGRPWDGAVVVTIDEVELIPLTPAIHPLVSVLTAVSGATGVISTTAGSVVDLTDPGGGRASWIVEGELCFWEQR
jgi:hypothetical protein